MSQIEIEPLDLEGLFILESKEFSDERGTFFRAYCEEDLAQVMGGSHIAQANISETTSIGAVRGMHYQKHPASEKKIIRCLSGSIFDVAVDLRANSGSFLHWRGVTLTCKTNTAFLIPEGFAHGFQVLEGPAKVLYLHSGLYSPQMEGGINPLDPSVGIEWPKSISQMSEKDRLWPMLKGDFQGLYL